DDVDLSGDPLDGLFAEVAPAAVVRVFQVNQASLSLDRVDCRFWRQPTRNGLLEEEADELALTGQDFLADDSRCAGLEERLSACDTFMIREKDRGESHLTASASHLQWWHAAIKRSRAVK